MHCVVWQKYEWYIGYAGCKQWRYVRSTSADFVAQRNIDIARERGMSIKEVLIYDHIDDNTLFVGDMTSKPVKSALVTAKEIPL